MATLYGYIIESATEPTAPDKATMISGAGADWAGSVAVPSDGNYYLDGTGLTTDQKHWGYLYVVDGGNDTDVLALGEVTPTAGGGVVIPIFFNHYNRIRRAS